MQDDNRVGVMESQKSFFSALCWALIGFSLVIIVHECGHFIVARFFDIACPIFSIGFGPALISMLVGNTTFQLALIPLGGYVLVDPEQFNHAAYGPQCLITMAGIFFNLFFAYLLFLLLSIKKNAFQAEEKQFEIHGNHQESDGIFQHTWSLYLYTLTHLSELASHTFARGKQGFIGPIGIIKGLLESAKDGAFLYIISIAMLNINIALFNLLPIPFLDGGKFVEISVNALFGKQPLSVLVAISAFLLFLIMTMLSYFQQPVVKTESPSGDL